MSPTRKSLRPPQRHAILLATAIVLVLACLLNWPEASETGASRRETDDALTGSHATALTTSKPALDFAAARSDLQQISPKQHADAATPLGERPQASEPAKRGLLGDLFYTPHKCDAQSLWLYAELNPDGVSLPNNLRSAFARIGDAALGPLRIMQSKLGRLHTDELQHLAETGALRPLKLKATPEIRARIAEARADNRRAGIDAEPMFRGSSFYEDADGLELFHRHEGVVYGAAKADLKFASMHFDHYLDSACTAYVHLVTLARSFGVLDEAQFDQRLAEARDWAEAHRRR